MATEIERKFLVANDGWRQASIRKDLLRDGLISMDGGRKVRVRLYSDRATLAVKGKRHGISRAEFEYDIPVGDALDLFTLHCDGRTLDKTRHYVPYAGQTWEVDVYHGLLEGVIVAEIELNCETDTFELPHWIGKEITGDPRYKKSVMLTERQKKS